LNSEFAVIFASVAIGFAALEAVIIGVLVIALVRQCSVSRRERDFLLWQVRTTQDRVSKLEEKHGKLDETVEEWIEAATNAMPVRKA
jgi:hypothetical protein